MNDKLKIITNILEDKSRNRFREGYFRNNHQTLYKEMVDYWDNKEDIKVLPFVEKVYHFVYDLEKSITCKCCSNKPKLYDNWLDGYRKFCSPKCAAICEDTKEVRKQTCIVVYGVDNPSKTQAVKNRIEATNIRK